MANPAFNPRIKAVSPVIRLYWVNEPLQGHLGVTGKNT